MPIVRTGFTPEDLELKKWNTPKREGGMAPDGYEPYPKMLYRAIRLQTGKIVCLEENPDTMQPYNGTNILAHSDAELGELLNRGWRKTPPEAHQYFEQQEIDKATAGAEVNAAALRMGGKAQAELARKQGKQAPEHVTE